MSSKPARSPEEAREILTRLRDKNKAVALMFEFGIRTGLRYSDVAKLTFAKVMINGVVRESFTVVQSKAYNARLKHVSGKKAEERAKEASKVTIYVNDELRTLIETLYIINGHGNLLFASTHAQAKEEKAISSQFINRLCRQVAAEMRLPYQLSTHSARKTFAKFLLDGGASLAVIKDALGHSSVAVTDAYLSTFDDELKGHATKISF